MKTCPKCNDKHQKPGIFCSRRCANSRQWSDEVNQKRSLKMKEVSPWNKGLSVGPNEEKNKAIRESRLQKTRDNFLNGLLVERSSLKTHLSREYGYFCAICSISEWQGKKISLQLDHIDGDAGNNNPANLRLICPNCHSQTETFGSKNKGNGRKSRGLPLY